MSYSFSPYPMEYVAQWRKLRTALLLICWHQPVCYGGWIYIRQLRSRQRAPFPLMQHSSKHSGWRSSTGGIVFFPTRWSGQFTNSLFHSLRNGRTFAEVTRHFCIWISVREINGRAIVAERRNADGLNFFLV